MPRSKELIVVDFDGTLFFTEKCTKLAAREILKKNLTRTQMRSLKHDIKDRVYDLAFTKYNHHSILNKKLNHLLQGKRDSEIIILTARPKTLDVHLRLLLNKHRVKVDKVIQRNKKEMKLDDEEWKRIFLSKMLRKYKRVILYEDKMDNIEYIHTNLNSQNMVCYLVSPRSIKKVR